MLNSSIAKNVLKLFTVILLVLITTACNNQDELIINFESNGGSEVSSLTFTDQKLNILPNDPIKTDAEFVGWYIDQDLNEAFSIDEIESYLDNDSITLYAKWKEHNYQIVFDSNGGSEMDAMTVMYGDEIPDLPEPSKDDMFFYGWFEDEDLSIPFSFETMPKTDLTLYARWSDNIYTYELNESDEATLTDYNLSYHETYLDSSDTLIIPDEVDGYPVISLTQGVFDDIILHHLSLPNSIEILPMGIFKDLQFLESLSIPFVGESRTANGSMPLNMTLDFMFDDVQPPTSGIYMQANSVPLALEHVVITDATQIGFGAFAGTHIKSVRLNEGITSIDSFAFGATSNLSTLSLPSTLETIASSAFDGASAIKYFFIAEGNPYFSSGFYNVGLYNKDKTELIKYSNGLPSSYEIPDTVTKIHDFAFQHSLITHIEIPNSVTEIGIGAFQFAKYLNTITFETGSQLEVIDIYTFSYSGIREIVIPASVKEIKFYAFSDAYELEHVSFEDNSQLETIGPRAFLYTTGLKSVYIPISVTTIDQYAFFDNNQIVIYVAANEKPEGWSDKWFEGSVVWGYVQS